jgi:uncharacterized integral membrane protein (TIGR00697 family)
MPKERMLIDPHHRFKNLDIIAVIFTLVLVLSNFASSAKIIDWGLSIGKLPLAFDAGTIFFPVAYIFNDVLTEVYGYAKSRRVIWLGFGSLIFTFLMFFLIQRLPGEASWMQSVGQDAFDKVFYGISFGGLVLASITAYLVGSFSNAILMAIMKHWTKGRLLWARTISSTIVGEFLDSLVFILIGSLTKVFPYELFWTLVITNYIFKVLVEVLMTPVTYRVIAVLKKSEGIDGYSDLSDLNPLKL